MVEIGSEIAIISQADSTVLSVESTISNKGSYDVLPISNIPEIQKPKVLYGIVSSGVTAKYERTIH